ncbi:UvrD-helicase domain-containing protein [bacterium]|nr:UvrD-helicase domain-containing protein [bacterium]
MKNNNFEAIVIEASAGTGKTRRITNEFLKLLDNSNPAVMMKKILAITFSEKAAIEMKSRIFERIYKDIYPSLGEQEKVNIENVMMKLNISTIHSFCRRLLKRFSFYLKLDPFFQIASEEESNMLFYRSFGKVLNRESAENMADGILKTMKLNALRENLVSFWKNQSYINSGYPTGDMTKRILNLYTLVTNVQKEMKKELSLFDFNDLENEANRLLKDSSKALNILEDFDEMHNFIFVDEFQDTNIVQWQIIETLFEEWLSGSGAKADTGEPYGIFLVGDKKQSIYKFRGAESGIFDVAKKSLSDFKKEEKLSNNYRSSKGILEFINKLFEDIPPWDEQKLYPGLKIELPYKVEIQIFQGENSKESEYEWVTNKILKLVADKSKVWNREKQEFRPIDFKDIAILLRGRSGTKFTLLEQTLKGAGFPFVFLGGMGFYQEPEIIFLISLLFALADPSDHFSLWILSNSVSDVSIQDITDWREMLKREELTFVFEKIIKEKNILKDLNTQQKANVEKFLLILQDWQDLPLYEIADSFRDLISNNKESKADIFSVHHNAVRVLTVHSAKGLEFPAVFLINIEDGNVKMRDNFIYDKGDSSSYQYVLKAESEEPLRNSFRNSLREEEMRVLYVACTRASHYLFISGKDSGGETKYWLNTIKKLQDEYLAKGCEKQAPYIKVDDIPEEKKETKFNFSHTTLTSYTKEADIGYYNYKKIVLGQILHKLLYDISSDKIDFTKSNFEERAKFYLKKSGMKVISDLMKVLLDIYDKIQGNMEIRKVIEYNGSDQRFSELPFIVKKGEKVYEGFIDRVIFKDGIVYLYDYKLEAGPLSNYFEQLKIYELAVQNIFKTQNVKKFIVSLKEGKISKI